MISAKQALEKSQAAMLAKRQEFKSQTDECLKIIEKEIMREIQNGETAVIFSPSSRDKEKFSFIDEMSPESKIKLRSVQDALIALGYSVNLHTKGFVIRWG